MNKASGGDGIPAELFQILKDDAAFSKTSLYIWKFMVHVLLKPGLENFEHYFASVWDEYNCAVVWAFFGIAFFGIRMKTDIFESRGHCWIFQFADILSVALSQHHLLGFDIAQLESHHLHKLCS